MKDALQKVLMTHDITTREQHELYEKAKTIFDHPELAAYFEEGNKVWNERTFVSPKYGVLRPDRLVFTGANEMVLIDYKTGAEQESHLTQIAEYTSLLTEMGYKVRKRYLIYVNDLIDVKLT